ncbi:hypothetical protein D7X33_43515 [Butyricicoccus sp. 1XD8-22]|nr:hypothetical protein D7X33_43515 [Butyricicoccus sp. 1XD8-22]
MGEKTGFMGVLLIFAIFIVPFLFNMFDNQVKGSKLLSLSNEVQQLVVAEGDITPTVKNVVNDLRQKGVTIEFRDKSNRVINSSPGLGEKVVMVYKYDGFETSNSATITKR